MTAGDLILDSTAVGTGGAYGPKRQGVSDALIALANVSRDALVGTGDLAAIRHPSHSLVNQESWTNAGITRRDREASPSPNATALLEIKKLGGLTWTQLARFLGVDRRSVHSWAAGGRLSARREEQLYRLLNVARESAQETPEQTRRALFEAIELLGDQAQPPIKKIGISRERPSRGSAEPHFLDLLAPPE